MSGRNQLLAGPNDLPQGRSPAKEAACPVHGMRTDAHGVPQFAFSSQRVDWRTLHGVDLDTLVPPPACCSPEQGLLSICWACTSWAHTACGQPDSVSSAQVEEGNLVDLQRCLQAGLLHGNLAAEAPSKLTLNNLLHFARLAQLGLQYLQTSSEPDPEAAATVKVRPVCRNWQGGCKQGAEPETCNATQALKKRVAAQDQTLQQQQQAMQAAKDKVAEINLRMRPLQQQLFLAEAEIQRLKDGKRPDDQDRTAPAHIFVPAASGTLNVRPAV